MAFALAVMAFSSAHGADEFGSEDLATDDELTESADGLQNPPNYTGGIRYNNSQSGLTLVLDDPAITVTSAASGQVDGVAIFTSQTAAGGPDQATVNALEFTSIDANRVGIYVVERSPDGGGGTITLGADAGVINSGNTGLLVLTNGDGDGDATVTVNGGTINAGVSGVASNNNRTGAGDATITVTDGAITSTGADDFGLSAARGASAGDAFVTISGGSVLTTANGTEGIRANAFEGNATTTVSGTADIDTQGDDAYGVGAVAATQGVGLARITGGTVDTAGARASGVISIGAGTAESRVEASGGTVSTSGASSHGLFARGDGSNNSGATVVVSGNVVVNAQNANTNAAEAAIGAYALNQSAAGGDATVIVRDNATIQATGLGSNAVFAFHNIATSTGANIVTIEGGTISTTGDGANGVQTNTNGTGETVYTMTGGDISTAGSINARGVRLDTRNGGDITAFLNGGTITTAGTNSEGLFMPALTTTNVTGQLVANVGIDSLGNAVAGTTIQTNGQTSTGVYVQGALNNAGTPSDATINFASGSVTTTGLSSIGLRAESRDGGDSTVNLTGGTINTTGTGVFANQRDANAAGTGNAVINAGGATVDIDVSQGNANGLWANNAAGGSGNAEANFSQGTIDMAGPGSFAVRATAQGTGNASASTGEATINANTGSSIGIDVSSGTSGTASVTVTGTEINADGAGGRAIRSVSNTLNNTVSISNADLSAGAAGGGGPAVVSSLGAGATGDGSVSVADSTIASGNDAAGSAAVAVRNNGSGNATVIANGSMTNVTSVGDAGAALEASITPGAGNGGIIRVDVDGGNYTASGPNASGILAAGNTGTITVDVDGGANVSATGAAGTAGGFGIHAAGSGGSTINIGAGSTITGSSGFAIRTGDRDLDGVDEPASASAGGTVAAAGGNSLIQTAGVLVGGVKMGFGNDTISLTDGSITGDIFGDDDTAGGSVNDGNDQLTWSGGTFTGAFRGENGSDRVFVDGATSYTGNQILDGGDDRSRADGFIDQLQISNASLMTADASSLQGWEEINLQNTNFGTATDFEVGTVGEADTSLSLSLGSEIFALDADFRVRGNLEVNPGNTLNLLNGAGAGVFGVTGFLRNDGLITTADGNAGDTFTVAGDYNGSGAIELDVDLAASTADTVVLAGAVSGTTSITINEINPGAAQDSQILIVDSGVALDGQFVVSPTSTGGANGYSIRVENGNVILVVEAPEVPVTPSPTPNPSPTPVTPFVATSASVTAEGVVAALSNIERMRSLRSRLGDIVGSSEELERFERGALWAQYQGTFSDQRGSSQGAFHDTETTEFDFGGSIGVGAPAGGKLLVGMSGHYVNSQTQSSLGTLGGNSETEGAGIGVEATWVADSGLYVDAKLRHLWLSSDAETRAGGEYGIDSTVFQLSAEAGMRFDLGEGNWITPQVQIQYTDLDADSVVSNGTLIALEDGSAAHARIGVDLGHTSDNGLITVWTTANLIAELDNGSSFRFGNETLNPNPDDLLFEFGAGGSVKLTEATGVYGEILGGTGLGNSGDDDYIGGNLGVKVAF